MELVINVKCMEKRKVLLRKGHEVEVTLPNWVIDEERVVIKVTGDDDNNLLGFSLLMR